MTVRSFDWQRGCLIPALVVSWVIICVPFIGQLIPPFTVLGMLVYLWIPLSAFWTIAGPLWLIIYLAKRRRERMIVDSDGPADDLTPGESRP